VLPEIFNQLEKFLIFLNKVLVDNKEHVCIPNTICLQAQTIA